jgi:NAD(P)-dependent dehydrogenase (short-subunit alcohol dehydrogenase family)
MTTSAHVHQTEGQCPVSQRSSYPDIAGKVVVITGCGSGIGLAMAKTFARCGARLMLIDINDEALSRAKNELEGAHPGVEVEIACGSTTDEAVVEAAVERAHARFGEIDVLLNNAGIAMNKPTIDLPVDEWRRAIDINLTGVFICAQAAGRRMIAQRRGVILNTASMYGVVAAPERAAYCASKAAVVSLTKVLAVEWAQFGIRVNALAPGYIRTALIDELIEAGRLDVDLLTERTPMGRLGEPDEIAELALFLASDSAAFITGQAIVADGGWSADGYMLKKSSALANPTFKA